MLHGGWVNINESILIIIINTHGFMSVDTAEGPRTLKRTLAACMDPFLGKTYCFGVV